MNGLPFSTIADSTAGGRQVDGFHGLSIEYMRSPKFLQSDGGWERIVWMPSEIKERVGQFIPEDMKEKIPTEKDVSNIEELKSHLEEKSHPIIERWKEVIVMEETPPETTEETIGESTPQIYTSNLPITAGGFKIILKDATINARKVIIKRIDKKA